MLDKKWKRDQLKRGGRKRRDGTEGEKLSRVVTACFELLADFFP